MHYGLLAVVARAPEWPNGPARRRTKWLVRPGEALNRLDQLGTKRRPVLSWIRRITLVLLVFSTRSYFRPLKVRLSFAILYAPLRPDPGFAMNMSSSGWFSVCDLEG